MHVLGDDQVGSRGLYRGLVEQSPAAAYVDRLDGVSVYVSPQMERVTGIPPERWAAGYDEWLALVHPDDRARVWTSTEEFLISGSPEGVEYRIVQDDGEVRWIHERSTLVRDDDGEPILVQGVVLDVTAEREAEQGLARSERLFRALIEHGHDAVTVLDREGNFRFGNASMGRIVGLAPDQFEGRSPLDLLHPDDVERARDVLTGAIAGGSPPTPHEFRLVHADGSTRIIEATLTNLLDDPTVCGIIVNYHDVTARKRAEQALEVSEEHRSAVLAAMINAEEQARRRIAGELHDDTIQAITAALLGLDRIASAADRGDVSTVAAVSRAARSTLRDAAERARRLTFELRPPVLDMHGLAAAVEQLAREAGQAAGFTVTLETELGRYPEPVETLVYRTIREALINIRKHARAGNVAITVCEQHDRIDVEVEDDGQGFDPDTVATTPSHGVQLHFGLDTSRERIRLAQGRWEVRSKPGQGTTLRFSVPLADATAAGGPS